MEPQIRYVRSADGTRLAVATMGRGRPLIILPTGWLTCIDVYWQMPETRATLERFAQCRQVAIFDTRGSGLSEREVTDFSLEARVGDLIAVIEGLDAPVVDLLAQAYAGPMAVSYAVKNPEGVGRLILSNAVAHGRDVLRRPRQRALRQLIEVDFDLYVQAWALVYFGWTDLGRRVAEVFKNATTADVFLAALRTAREDDVRDLLPELRCPTLVMHGRDEQIVSLSSSQQLAAAIPNARFVAFDPEHVLMLATEAMVPVMEEFLDEGAGTSKDAPPSGTAAVLFADIADSTGLTERLGDAAFRERARGLDAALRAAIRENGGTPIEGKLLGDGVLAVFISAREAIEAALRCGTAGNEAGLPLHVGLHAGDVIREEDPDGRANVYGGAVNIASRISGLSAPGEVLVSETVRSLARTSAGVAFEDRGEQSLKGVSEAVRVWAVREAGPSTSSGRAE